MLRIGTTTNTGDNAHVSIIGTQRDLLALAKYILHALSHGHHHNPSSKATLWNDREVSLTIWLDVARDD